MPDHFSPRQGRFIILTVVVCVAAGTLSGILGLIASLLYEPMLFYTSMDPSIAPYLAYIPQVGIYWGATSGLLAALIWCGLLWRRLARGQTERWATWGWKRGVLVGILATISLHTGLMLVTVWTTVSEMLVSTSVGMLFGIPAGAILGAVCGAICQVIVDSSVTNHTPLDPANGLDA